MLQNHEIVISTLHQILKDAVAAQGGTLPASLTAESIGNSPAAVLLAQGLLGDLAGLNLAGLNANGNQQQGRTPSLDIASNPSLESADSALLGQQQGDGQARDVYGLRVGYQE
jgi:hypothetical protein